MTGFARFTKRWGSTGSKLDPSDTQADAGFAFLGATPPSVELFNAIHQDLDDKDNALYGWISVVLLAAGITPADASPGQLLAALGTIYGHGRFLNVQVFTSSATYTPTVGMNSVVFEVQGGGAAGGGATGAVAGNVSLGAPGTSGSYARAKLTAADIGVSKVVSVGAGGTGVSAGIGNNGGASSVGSLITAPGGVGGGMLNNAAVPTANGNGSASAAPGGAGVVGSNGTAGSPSLAMTAAVALGGQGGASVFGPANATTQVNQAGAASTNPGAGGGGCVLNSGGGSAAGGSGFRGVVIAWEYS